MIYFVKNLKESFRYNRFRTVLTGLGVFIGIAAVIIIMTISNSFSNNLVNKYVNNTTIGLISSADSLVDMESVMNDGDIKDNLEIVRNLPGVKEFKEAYTEETVDVYFEDTDDFKENVVAEFRNIGVIEGESFQERSGNVVIVKDNEEFDKKYTIGDTLYVNNESYEIIGITDEIGNTNPSLYLPEDLRSEIDVSASSISSTFNLTLEDGYELESVSKQVLEMLNNGLDDDVKFIDYSEETSKAIKESIGSISIFLVLIGAISLVVAGINVINIMYISTLEKMNEVAIYRAMGMKKTTVISLFLMESLILVIVFALLGYFVGLLIAGVILTFMDIPMVFSIWHVLLVLFISMLLGIGGGIKPAINAANSNPATLLK
ncbi:ABC transporter permease [Metabacillus malikii]|uniref:ABC transport system permease protein n=1 Tax=Metabacillus malikii TaxID=1504265 RepID=A0ABT9ZJE8_9BACI|nr:ABC transporter permease [Metabacillus malikii]MDQ0231663.1 putative ABC transport system permease protein [Metabacillus malikii]